MKRLLFMAHRVPYPPDKGERVRAFHEILALADRFRVTVACLAHRPEDTAAAAQLRRFCDEVVVAPAGGTAGRARAAWSLLAGRSATEGFFRSPRLTRTVTRTAAAFDLVFAYCSSMLPHAMAVPAPARVIDLVDVDSAKWAAYAAQACGPRRWLYARESRAVRALELEALAKCQATLLVSRAEARALGAAGEGIIAVSNGVDTEYFTPSPPPAAGAPALVFTGTMDYRPNVEGVTQFVRDVWPGLRRRAPQATFTIVGRDPTRAVQQLADVPGVTVTGSVADVRPYLAAASVVVTPLVTARGIQNKILEAMAAGRPVVASTPALEGLDVKVGEELLRADTPEEWLAAILGLASNLSERQAMGQAARARAVADYSWDARMAPLVALCERLAGPET
jgi:sugar transferase (PEP-CTERM/EpsH1 system associated)